MSFVGTDFVTAYIFHTINMCPVGKSILSTGIQLVAQLSGLVEKEKGSESEGAAKNKDYFADSGKIKAIQSTILTCSGSGRLAQPMLNPAQGLGMLLCYFLGQWQA